jgi:hypothetical protein
MTKAEIELDELRARLVLFQNYLVTHRNGADIMVRQAKGNTRVAFVTGNVLTLVLERGRDLGLFSQPQIKQTEHAIMLEEKSE